VLSYIHTMSYVLKAILLKYSSLECLKATLDRSILLYLNNAMISGEAPPVDFEQNNEFFLK
jgi:hypothetical protein